MRKFTLTHEINCDEETFWKIFFDREFTQTLFRQVLRFPAYEIVEQTSPPDGRIARTVRGQPHMKVPGPVAAVVGDSLGYEEVGQFDPEKKVFGWKTTTNKLPGKLRQEGSVRIERAGEGKVKRISEITVEAKIFGVGGLIENTTEEQFRVGWDRSAAFMNQWVEEHRKS
ncbi:MAG: DUF2505 domain-containing protein [Deltaproteobacteria bacterium]|nr:DUF2505 domain-containing protein [Deltaproteobacteria bacterium]